MVSRLLGKAGKPLRVVFVEDEASAQRRLLDRVRSRRSVPAAVPLARRSGHEIAIELPPGLAVVDLRKAAKTRSALLQALKAAVVSTLVCALGGAPAAAPQVRLAGNGTKKRATESVEARGRQQAAPGAPASARLKQLTPREQQVLLLLAQGLSNKRIARALDVEVRTVESHRLNLRRKLNIATREDLERHAAMLRQGAAKG